MTDVSPRKEIHLFSGFGQRPGQPSGTSRAWRKIYEKCAGSHCVVRMHHWNTDPEDLAQRIANSSYGIPKKDVKIVLGGYSFGGMTAALVAKRLQAVNLDVQTMVLTDPVYRHRYYAGWWRSLMPWCEIAIPENVGEVFVLAQKNPRFEIGRQGGWIQPAGHEVVHSDWLGLQETVIHDTVYFTAEHAAMDELREYRDKLLEACECSD